MLQKLLGDTSFHRLLLRGCVQNKSKVEFSPMSATESDSTSGSVAKMNGPGKKCLPSAPLKCEFCCLKPGSD